MKLLKSMRKAVRWTAVLLACVAIPVLMLAWSPSMRDAYTAGVERVEVDPAPRTKDVTADRLAVNGKAAFGQLSLSVVHRTQQGRDAASQEPGWHTGARSVKDAAHASWEGGLYNFVAKPVHSTDKDGNTTKGFTVGMPMGFLLMVCMLVLLSEARHAVSGKGETKEKK